MGSWHPTGRARVSSRRPSAHAVCDRCQFRYNLGDLRFQHQWTGDQLQNIQLLVCRHCYDTPQQQLRAIIIPADPLPVLNPRPEQYIEEVWTYRTTQSGAVRVTQSGAIRVVDSSAANPDPTNI